MLSPKIYLSCKLYASNLRIIPKQETCGANVDLHPLSSRQSHTTNLNAPHNGRCTMNTTGTMTPGSPPTNLNGNCEETLGKEGISNLI